MCEEAGPFYVGDRFRSLFGVVRDAEGEFDFPAGDTRISKLQLALAEEVTCFWCCSLGVGLLWLVLWLVVPTVALYVALAPALSAGAVILYSRGVRVRKVR